MLRRSDIVTVPIIAISALFLLIYLNFLVPELWEFTEGKELFLKAIVQDFCQAWAETISAPQGNWMIVGIYLVLFIAFALALLAAHRHAKKRANTTLVAK